MEKFQYQAIEPPHEIRMLELIPGTASTPIQVRLVHKSLSQMPQCIALSYEWGARTGDSEIICDNATLKVTKNLIKGLKRLRKFQGLAPGHNPYSNRLKITERTLCWIDAICINQDDLDERSQQGCCLAGEEVARSQEVWDLVAPLGDQVDKFKVDMIEKNKEEYGSTIVCPGLMLKDLSKHPAFVDIMDTFSARTLFIRLWTIQETCLAHGFQVTILYGRVEMPWNTFSGISSILFRCFRFWKFRDEEKLPRIEILTNIIMRRQIQENAPLSQEDFFDMLLASTFVHASDERDRVFGVLGLFGEDTRAPFSNLGYRNEPKETFRAATEAIVNTCDKGLEYLTYNYAVRGDDSKLMLPSWTLLDIHFTVRAHRKAAETNDAELKLGRLKKTLTGAFDPVEQYEGWICRILLREWERSTSKDESSDTWRGILLSTLRERAALRFAHLGRRVQDDTLRRDHNDQLTGEGRNIFATSKEYFGIGAYGKNDPGSPLAVQVNDKIVIMHGVKQPLVLYPCGNSEYKFVGPSLIPEVEMDESVQVENRKPMELIRIV
ncbi:uncharacterized protein EAE98_007565 [Botrytis deweyae]|uniref:Heterokaryon incompatibility domain-containing protein n=1 Tax=Botrytis deweyae TaxID=2478750 RepID=A0ABQ7IGM7_9HELO|nr:uncharacterized protein EAE98_007565 [Botrytis deweyae]KAF7923747.1 hypothetical protein EAE98_007565 [Botrytis deweyae]